jgi:Na+/melibiose symporter-like transporter
MGQGAIMLSHLAIVNSITYDQLRRETLLNYRNSSGYGAGILVPFFTFFLFTYIDNQID